jgi:hypothetical protein
MERGIELWDFRELIGRFAVPVKDRTAYFGERRATIRGATMTHVPFVDRAGRIQVGLRVFLTAQLAIFPGLLIARWRVTTGAERSVLANCYLNSCS